MSWLTKLLNEKIPADEQDAYVRFIIYAPDPPITTISALIPSQVKVVMEDLRTGPSWPQGGAA